MSPEAMTDTPKTKRYPRWVVDQLRSWALEERHARSGVDAPTRKARELTFLDAATRLESGQWDGGGSNG